MHSCWHCCSFLNPIFLASLWFHAHADGGLCQRLFFYYSGCNGCDSLHCARNGTFTCIPADNETNHPGNSTLAVSVYYAGPTRHICMAAFCIHTTTAVALSTHFSDHL